MTACAKNLRYEIDSVVKRRTELIRSELKVARRKFPTGAKPRSRKNRQAVRGRLVSDGEVRQLLRHYSSLIEEREHILKRDVLKRQKALRDTERKLSIEKERYRPRNNLHNFTIYQLDPKLQTLLEKNGGFVPGDVEKTKEFQSVKALKKHAEEAVLTCAVGVTRSKHLSFKKLIGNKNNTGSYNPVRQAIRHYLTHPNMTNSDRNYIYNSLKLIDRLVINYIRLKRKGAKFIQRGDGSVNSKFKDKDLQTIAQLQKAASLTNSKQVILRESDKKMGWSLNSTDWYRSEYIRHLKSDFYKRVGSVGQVQAVKRSCREEFLNILSKYKEKLSNLSIQKFCSHKLEDYILPSMNLMPKVHKLTRPASHLNEGELKGRPIITAHSWCTVEASKFLQSKLREIISYFKAYLSDHGMESTILSDSKSLVDILKQYRVRPDGMYTIK